MGYKLTIKALICTSILLVLSCIGTIIVYATESGGTTQTLQVVLSDLEQQEADKVVTLPDKAIIKNVSVNTGEVTYEKSGNSVSLHLKNGEGTITQEEEWNDKKYSKIGRANVSILSKSWWYHDDDGYSGELTDYSYTSYDSFDQKRYNNFSGTVYKGGYDLIDVTTYNYTVNIDYIVDTAPPQLDVSYDNNPTNGNVTFSVNANDSVSGVKEITLPNGSIVSELPAEYEATENGDYTFSVTDNAENTATKTITVSCIDKTAPQFDVTYDESPTNKNITFSVSATDDESGIKEITLPNGSVITEPTTTYEITENGDYSFTTTDNAGNTSTETVTVSCIDNVPPVIDIVYDDTPTKDNITISVSSTDNNGVVKEILLPDNSIVTQPSTTYEVTKNGDYTFTATDDVGNTATETVTISCIDNVPPVIEVSYDNTPTQDAITLSVSANDDESGVKEITLPDDSVISELPTEYQITTNGEYTFSVTDNAGNVATKTVTVTCIDKDVPIISSHKIDYKENKIYVTIESDEENLTYLISESQDIQDLEFKAENEFELACEGTYYAFAKDSVGNISLPYQIIVSSPKLPQISVDIENGEFQGGTSVTITVTSQDTELKSYKYIVTSSADYPLPDDTWITPDDIAPKTVTISSEGEQYIHVFANDVFGNIATKTFGSYMITPKPVVTEPTQTDTSPQTVVTESNEEKTIETEEVITTEPIETQEIPIETELPQTKIITPEIAPPEVIFPTVTENIEEEKQPKEIPVLVIGNEDKNFTLYESDIEGVETIQILDDTGNEIAEFEPENIEKIKVNPPKKDGYDFVGYEKTHIETYLVLTPTYKASPGYDGMETFEISPSPMPESVVNISNLDNQSTLLRGLVYTIAILAIIVLILSIIALTYKISNLRAERNSR